MSTHTTDKLSLIAAKTEDCILGICRTSLSSGSHQTCDLIPPLQLINLFLYHDLAAATAKGNCANPNFSNRLDVIRCVSGQATEMALRR